MDLNLEDLILCYKVFDKFGKLSCKYNLNIRQMGKDYIFNNEEYVPTVGIFKDSAVKLLEKSGGWRSALNSIYPKFLGEIAFLMMCIFKYQKNKIYNM